MRVYFGVCGIGLGHVGRCIPIAHKLRLRGDSVFFSTYRDAIPFVQREGFPLGRAPPIGFIVKPDGSVDFRKTTADPGPFSLLIVLKQIIVEIQFMKLFKPDIVVSDSRLSTLIAAKLLSIPSLTILNLYRVSIPRKTRFLNLSQIADGAILTILGKMWELGERILIPDLPSPYTLSTNNLAIPSTRMNKFRLIGTMLSKYPQDLPDNNELHHILKVDKNKSLIFAPISGSKPEKAPLIELLRKIFPKLPQKYQIIMSLGDPKTSFMPVNNGNLMIYDWLPTRFEFLKLSDIVICKGGLGTISQAIAYGKPLVIIPTPNHTEQINNAKRAEDLGVGKMLHQEELNLDNLLSCIEELLLDEVYVKNVREISKDISHIDAVKTAIDIITKYAQDSS